MATAEVELGVFLPVGNNGWIISSTSPQYLPTFQLNREIAEYCEAIGFDYLFSMAKWRGFFGDTGFWNHTVESMMLMAGLAPITRDIRLIASIAPALIHPAVFAKMAATLDDICQGRLAINIVSAANKDEYTQMGLWPDDFESYRYDYTAEWLHIVKRLWTEDAVTFHGQYFQVNDCWSNPKPVQRPYPKIVCATSSERGFQFVAEECDYAFLTANSAAAFNATSRKAKDIGARHGRTIRTQAHLVLILGETDAQAEALFASYRAGADRGAIDNIFHLRVRDASAERAALLTERRDTPGDVFYSALYHVGGPERTADFLADLVINGQTDGIVLTFQDYLPALKLFQARVMPAMRRHGIRFARAG